MEHTSHEFLKALLETPSPSGFEQPVQQVVRDWVKPFADDVRTDRHGNVHVPVGKVSFEPEALVANVSAVLDELQRAKPAAAKGKYFRKVTLATTMGPGIKVDPARSDG